MTGEEIQRQKEILWTKYYGDECRIIDNLKMPWSKEDEILMEELDCRDMIHSILIYGSSADVEEGSYDFNRYLTRYYDKSLNKEVLLSKSRVLELIKEEKEEISNAVIHRNVYTDFEGCTYNSIEYRKRGA